MLAGMDLLIGRARLIADASSDSASATYTIPLSKVTSETHTISHGSTYRSLAACPTSRTR
jgi:hypothetical protein